MAESGKTVVLYVPEETKYEMSAVGIKHNTIGRTKDGWIVLMDEKDVVSLGSEGLPFKTYDLNRGIVNLTQHKSTPEQQKEGVFDVPPRCDDKLKELLTFKEKPTYKEIAKRAEEISSLACECSPGAKKAMIGGAPYLMSSLEEALAKKGIEPLYAFSKRESIEEVTPTGEVIKKSVFKHKGFISLKERIERALTR